MKVGDFVVERLHAWGVRRIYGYPGDGINGVIGALQRADNIEFIQVRHEEMAAFMALSSLTTRPRRSNSTTSFLIFDRRHIVVIGLPRSQECPIISIPRRGEKTRASTFAISICLADAPG
jgi:hypothetical protein